MLNCILFCVLLTAIGACYVWLGSRKKEREAQILTMHREIRQFEDRIKANELVIHRCLAPEELRARAHRAGLELKPIGTGPKGRLVRLPDPPVADGSPAVLPVFAGKFMP
jgi:hypothetical protein